jgi:uncharacterized membrane protein (DUF2068 family)
LVIDLEFHSIHRWATSLVGPLSTSGHATLASTIAKLGHLRSSTLSVLFGTAVLYAIIGTVEAVGLWRERRWAEYLTVIATMGFLPFEVVALVDKVTVLRIGAMAINIAILIYLVVSKRLFGLPQRQHDAVDWDAVAADPLVRLAGRT